MPLSNFAARKLRRSGLVLGYTAYDAKMIHTSAETLRRVTPIRGDASLSWPCNTVGSSVQYQNGHFCASVTPIAARVQSCFIYSWRRMPTEIAAATGRPESVFLVKRVARCRGLVVSKVTRVQPCVRIPTSAAASSAGATPDPCEPEWRPHFRSLYLPSYAATSSAAEDAEKTE